MKQFQYAVIGFEDGWRLLINGRRMARFSSASSALQLALGFAAEVQAMECDVEVLVHDGRGSLAAFPVSRSAPSTHAL